MVDYEKLMDSLFEEKTRWKEELEKNIKEKEAKGKKLDQAELGYKLKLSAQEAIKNTKTSKNYNPRVDDKNLSNLQKEAKGLGIAASRHQQNQELENRKKFNMRQNAVKGLLMTGAAAVGLAGAKAISNSIKKKQEEKQKKEQIQNKINELYQELKNAKLPTQKKQILAQIKSLSASLNQPAQQVNESTAADRYLDRKIEQAKKNGTFDQLMKKDKAAANRHAQTIVSKLYNRDSKYMPDPRSREDRLKNDTKKAKSYKDNILPELAKNELKKRQIHNFIPFSKKQSTSNIKEILKNPDGFKEPYEGKNKISNARRGYITKQQNKVEKQEKIEKKIADKKGREFVPSLPLRGEEKKIEKALRNNTMAPENASNKEIKQFDNQQQYKRRISPYAKAEETDRLVKQNAKAELLQRISNNKKKRRKDIPITSTQNKTKQIIGATLTTGAVATAGGLLKHHYDNKKKEAQEEENLRNEVNSIPAKFLKSEYNRAINEGNIKKADLIKERMK